jgi:Protein of unknown function (DUF3108)
VYSIRVKWKTLAVRLLLACLLIVSTAIVAASLQIPSLEAVVTHVSLHQPAPIPLPSDLDIPRYDPGPAPFRDGETLVYEASWVGIPAAEARIVLLKNEHDGRSWTGKLWLRSSKAVDLLYPMRDYVYEDFNRDDLRPREIHILQHEKRRRDEWYIHFDDHEHLVTSAKRNAQGRTWVREFTGGQPWGPFSGAMLALSLPLKVGESYTFDVFSGGNRYVLAFSVDRRESISTAFGNLPALRITPSVVWLSEGKFRNQVSQTVVWVADDEQHLPLRIEAAAFIGSIRVDLTQVVNAPQSSLADVGAHANQAQDDHFLSFLTPLSWTMP